MDFLRDHHLWNNIADMFFSNFCAKAMGKDPFQPGITGVAGFRGRFKK
jgi:hypothetical protein